MLTSLLGNNTTTFFDNMNTDGVGNGPPVPTFFGLAAPAFITRVLLYFFNGGIGADPQMVVYLRQVPNFPPAGIPGPGTADIFFGPFFTILSPGQGGSNSNVEIFPSTVIPAGRYEIVPTEPGKWSFNARSGNMGFARVEGIVVPDPANSPPTNQFERAKWEVGPGRPQKILWLQPIGTVGAASYGAIYRITNSEWSTLVTITTTDGSFTLQPGGSVDLSTTRIDIESTGLPAWGTFQDLCCALAVLQAPAALKDPFLWSFLPNSKGGGGGGGGGGGVD
jgi:hypothetical protein